jgi:hypothetical protein
MKRDLPSRVPSLAAAATTLVALVAMAAAAPHAEGMGAVRAVSAEITLLRGDGHGKVRAVAAAVAAVARDLLGAGATTTAWSAPESFDVDLAPRVAAVRPMVVTPRGLPPLAEHLLDLPPPGC